MRQAFLLACLVSGCATISPERGHDEVARILDARTGTGTGWERGSPDDTAISQRVDSLLATELTRPNAIAIALVNNPALQATYEELGISQADMVQVGLLKNPSLSGSVGFPLNALGATEFEFALVQDIVDLFTRSWRVDIAERQFNASIFRVAQQALETAGEVNRAFVTLQAEIEIEKLVQKTVEGAEGAQQLAEKQFVAGNITELALARERSTYARFQLEHTQAEVRVATAREHLTRLLGLWGKRSQFKISGRLSELPSSDPIPEYPEAVAIRQRLDLRAARIEEEILGQVLGLARSTRLFGRVEIGAHYHRDADGAQLVGPTFALELPIFDQRQAYIARIAAQQTSASRRVSAIAVDARSKVREQLLVLRATRATAEYIASTVVPLQDKIVEQSQLNYNGMLLGLYELIATQRESLEARRSAIASLRDYWIARFELELALGGALGREAEAAKDAGTEPHHH